MPSEDEVSHERDRKDRSVSWGSSNIPAPSDFNDTLICTSIDRTKRHSYSSQDDSEHEYKPAKDDQNHGLDVDMEDATQLPPQPIVSLQAQQLEFVIQTRDNNLPDPYGTHSTTTGKLEFPKVAMLYNKRFGLNVGAAAVEKRYRKNIQQYYIQNPTYPKVITYAPKVEGPPRRRPKKTLEQPEKKSAQGGENHNLNAVDAGGLEQPQKDNEAPKTKRRLHAGVYRPPRESTAACDLSVYIDATRRVPNDVKHPEKMVISVVDGYERFLGSINVPTEDLLASSGFYKQQRESTIVSELRVKTSSKANVERYAQCITPGPLSRLPQYDFALVKQQMADGTVIMRGLCTPIAWDLKALIDLYLVATEFEDDHVRNLILDHWFHQLRQGGELEVDVDPINLLYLRAPCNSRARKFWAMTLHAHGFSDLICNFGDGEKGWGSMIVNHLRAVEEDNLAPKHLQWTEEQFCHQFHRHVKGSNCHRHRLQDGNGSVPPDYFAIAHCMLPDRDLSENEAMAVAGAIALDFRVQHLALLGDQTALFPRKKDENCRVLAGQHGC